MGPKIVKSDLAQERVQKLVNDLAQERFQKWLKQFSSGMGPKMIKKIQLRYWSTNG